MNQGDIIFIPEGVKHWHGATPDNAMTHIAIAESLNGSPVEWLEKVTDEQYKNNDLSTARRQNIAGRQFEKLIWMTQLSV